MTPEMCSQRTAEGGRACLALLSFGGTDRVSQLFYSQLYMSMRGAP